jgi:uncharacterized protein (DUF1778 family)
MSDRAIKPRRHRLEVRVTPEQDALIRQAADLEDTTVTAFVLDTVTARAKGVVKQHNDLVLSNAFDRFIAELDKPAQTGRNWSTCSRTPETSRGASRARRVLLERLDTHHDVSTFDSETTCSTGLRRALAAQRMDSRGRSSPHEVAVSSATSA